MRTKFTNILLVLIFSTLLILLVSPISNQSQQLSMSQVGRYQLYEATITTSWEGFNINSEFISGDSESRLLLKMDTMTGEVYKYNDGLMFLTPDSIFHQASSWIPLLRETTFKTISKDTSNTK